MTTVMRTRAGSRLADSETSNPANVDYSGPAARTLSVDPKYDLFIVQGLKIGRSFRQPLIKFAVVYSHPGVEMQIVEAKIGRSTKLKWNECVKLVAYIRNIAKQEARPSQHQMANKRSAEATALKSKQDGAIAAAFGLLKHKNVLPLDALQFEREMRDE